MYIRCCHIAPSFEGEQWAPCLRVLRVTTRTRDGPQASTKPQGNDNGHTSALPKNKKGRPGGGLLTRHMRATYSSCKSREKREGYPLGKRAGVSLSPREAPGPPSLPGASLISAYRYSFRASLVSLTSINVSSPLSSYSRPHPAHRRGTGIGITVYNSSAGLLMLFLRSVVERRYGGPVVAS
jgi:hypothetical protein